MKKNQHLIPPTINDLIETVTSVKTTPNERRNALERLFAIREAITEAVGKAL